MHSREPKRTLTRAGSSAQVDPAKFIKALDSPQRRHILRILHDAGEARSPKELAVIYGVPVSHVSYHFRVLKKHGAVSLTDTRQRRGATEHFYASRVSGNQVVVGLLEATKASDEGAAWVGRRKRKTGAKAVVGDGSRATR
jgi:DNA-binding transcriptional ArsR family regulator